jgi:CheY-like chemotaxis protein
MTSEQLGTVILLVEDDPLLAATVRRTIERLPGAFSVNVAESAFEAKNSWEGLRPQMVLMDYRLPDGFGTDVIACMRHAGLRTPVVCMTAESESITEECRHALAISDVIQKPVSTGQLQSALMRGLDSPARPSTTEGARRDRRIGRFRRIRVPGVLTAEKTARLVRAARHEKWIALEASDATKADSTAMRSLCAWAGWLSAQGGRLCILAPAPVTRTHFEDGVGAFVDILDNPDTLRIQSQHLTGNAERLQLLNVIQPPDRPGLESNDNGN